MALDSWLRQFSFLPFFGHLNQSQTLYNKLVFSHLHAFALAAPLRQEIFSSRPIYSGSFSSFKAQLKYYPLFKGLSDLPRLLLLLFPSPSTPHYKTHNQTTLRLSV